MAASRHIKAMSLPYQKKLIPRATKLRKTATRQEKRLWYDFLSGHALRFQRQKVIGGYIVDFYCHAAKLVIELDGVQHSEAAAKLYDEERTRFLEASDLRVLRFSNTEIDEHFARVCRIIEETIKNMAA